MSNIKGTSNVPMIMGIIGAVLGIPASYCSGACGAAVGALADDPTAAEQLGSFYLYMGLLGAALGLVGGILGKKMPIPAGIIMLVATFMSGFTLIAGNMLALIVAILFLIGGIFCFTQPKENIKQSEPAKKESE